jgi:hypothetical protein
MATIPGDARYSHHPRPFRIAQHSPGIQSNRSATMAKNLILWMLGVPISVLILLNIFGFL